LAAACLSAARLVRAIGNRRAIGSISRRRSLRTTRITILRTAGGQSRPARFAGAALASCRARRERWGTLFLLRGAERGITAAPGARRTRSGTGFPPGESPWLGLFSLSGSCPCAGSCTRPRSRAGLRPDSRLAFIPPRRTSVGRCARSEIGAACLPGRQGWLRTRCETRPASSATHTLIFSAPPCPARRRLSCRLPRRPARRAWSGWSLPSCIGRGLGGRRLLHWPLFGRRCGFDPAEDRSRCRRRNGIRGGNRLRASGCLDLSRPGPLRQGSFRLRRNGLGSQPGELRQAVFQEVVGLRVHGEGMDLARGG
jgi:hypothetical protein